MIARQVSPWNPWWNRPATAFGQMRREMESLLDRLAGVTADGSAAGVFPR